MKFTKMKYLDNIIRKIKLILWMGYYVGILQAEVVITEFFILQEDATHVPQYVELYNDSDSPIDLLWVYDNEVFANTVNPGDSLYLKPFIKYAFGNPSMGNARMLVIGISGAVGLQTQRELSTLTNPSRVINELEPWFEEGT